MIGFIDIHCHILPGVDDGAKSMEDTIEIVKMAYKEGIRYMIATPHYHKGRYGRPVEELEEKLVKVREALLKAEIPMKVLLGNEAYYTGSLVEKLNKRRVLTLDNSKYVLVEFSPGDEYQYIKKGLNSILLGGFRPIIAHVERYQCLRKDIKKVEELYEMGVYIQVNAMSIVGSMGILVKAFTKNLMKNDLIHIIATDTHNIENRSPKLEGCVKILMKKYNEDYLRALLIENPKKILTNEYI